MALNKVKIALFNVPMIQAVAPELDLTPEDIDAMENGFFARALVAYHRATPGRADKHVSDPALDSFLRDCRIGFEAKQTKVDPTSVKNELRKMAAADLHDGKRATPGLCIIRETAALLAAAYFGALDAHLDSEPGNSELPRIEKEVSVFSMLLLRQLEGVIPGFRPPRRDTGNMLPFYLKQLILPSRLGEMMRRNPVFGEDHGNKFCGYVNEGLELVRYVCVTNRKPGFTPSDVLVVLNSKEDVAVVAEETHRQLANIRTTGIIEIISTPLVGRRSSRGRMMTI